MESKQEFWLTKPRKPARTARPNASHLRCLRPRPKLTKTLWLQFPQPNGCKVQKGDCE